MARVRFPRPAAHAAFLTAGALLLSATVPAAAQHQHDASADSSGARNLPVAGPHSLSLGRTASGTAWLPDAARQHGYHVMLGQWELMFHGAAFLQYVRQSGVRAAHQLGSANWLMAAATRPVVGGAVRLRAMASLEPLTLTGRGYPQLLQVAQPYHGSTVTDRQHPHDLLMEASATYELPLGTGAGLSFYVAPIGEPALGPVAFSHRPSAAYDPIAPLGHHTQDFSHTSFGVATLGFMTRIVRVEGSLFNGNHPDETRTNVDPIRLNSQSVRLSINPSPRWSVATWLGHFAATGGTHAHGALRRFGAALSHAAPLAGGREWATTLVYAADLPTGATHPLNTVLVESSFELNRANALFGRGEYIRRTAADLELIGSISRELDVGAVSLGYARTLYSKRWAEAAVGVRGTVNVVPAELELFYGSRVPIGVMAYFRVLPAP